MRKLLPIAMAMAVAAPVYGANSTYAEWVTYSQAILSLTILLFVLCVGIMALVWNYKHRRQRKVRFVAFAIRQPLVRLALFVMVLVGIANLVIPNPYSNHPHDLIDFARARRVPSIAEHAYKSLSERYPYVLPYHAEYLAARYEREFWAEGGEIFVATDEDQPVMRYSHMLFERDPYLKNIARLCIGICEYYEYSNDIAMVQFRSVDDPRLPYLGLFMGRIHASRMELDSASYYLRREISLGGPAVALATQELALLQYHTQADDLDAIEKLVDDPQVGTYVPSLVKRYLYTRRGDLGHYLVAHVKGWWDGIQWIGLIGALLGTIVWMGFLRRLDTFSKEGWLPILVVFSGGAIFSFLALVMYDFIHWDLGFYRSEDGNVGQDLLYCVFGIGVIEELVKFIPFLLLLQFTKVVRRPMSYIVYASASALGFAFVENLMYFDASHIGIIHGRVLICNVFHMFATSTIAYGMVQARYKFGKSQWLLVVPYFLLAAVLHGFYDFWLINQTVGLFVLVSMAFFVFTTFRYASYINNALNQSEVFRGRHILDAQQLAVFLTVGLVSVLLFEYVGLSMVYGLRIGNFSLLNSMGMGSFLMFFVVLNLSNIDMVQGEWNWLRMWNFGTRIAHNKVLGQRLRLIPNGAKSLLGQSLPAAGEIIARISLNGDSRYFLFQLDKALQVMGMPLEYVLLRATRENQLLEPNHGVEATVTVFRDKESLIRTQKRRSDFKVLDTVRIA